MTPIERFEQLKSKYYYDEAAAAEKIRFIEKHCRHVEGDLYGKPLILPDVFKDEIIRPVYGLKEKKGGRRMINYVYIQTPKKNAKTTMMAANELAMLGNDGEKGAQIYNCAGDDEQAGLLFNAASKMIELDPQLNRTMKRFQSSVTYKHSYIQKLTAKSDTKHGKNSHGVFYDELHVAKNRDLHDNLKTSMAQRTNPIMWVITTPGSDLLSICFNRYEYSKKILSGTINDDSFWCVIYESSPDDDIYSEDTWRKANPLYDYSENLRRTIRTEANEVKNDVSGENTFRRLRLGQWTSSETRWLKTELWTSLQNKDLKIDDFIGQPCWLGVDRSSTQDISSLCVLFEDSDILIPFWFLWISEASAKTSKDKFNIPYDKWEELGFIEIVAGTHVGPYGVKDRIIKVSDKFSIVIMGYDEWNTVDMAVELQDELDIETIIEKQGYGLSVGIKKIEEKIKAAQFIHNGNAVVTWCLENILVKTDDELREKFVKPKDYKKIDPWVSLAMAVRNWIEVKPKKSVYSERGVITID